MHLLKSFSKNNEPLIATFNPQKGMNLMSFRWGNFEIMDVATKPLFDERSAGLGALIGPHFHHRQDKDIPNIEVISLFPFVKKLQEQGQKEPFSHGIARYVPWRFKGNTHSIYGILEGNDEFKGIKLSSLEGQDFRLEFQAVLSNEGLEIDYGVESEKSSVIGLHYYYSLPQKKGEVLSVVDPMYHDLSGWKKIPDSWYQSPNLLCHKLTSEKEIDYGFRPLLDPQSSVIELHTAQYLLKISYQADSEENAWQLYRPNDSTFVCIEPVSAKNPREAIKSSSNLKIKIQIES